MKNNYFIASKNHTEDMEYIFPISETENKIVPISDILNDEFEILSEEDEEIDIEKIKQLTEYDNYKAYTNTSIGANRVTINELIKAVKQLNKKIKE